MALAFRFFGRFESSADAGRFYRTENAVLAVSLVAQSLIAVAILLGVVAPDAGWPLIMATVAYVMTRSVSC